MVDVSRDFDQLGELLSAADPELRSVTSDPAKLLTPGVWLRLDSLEHGTLQGYTLNLTAHLAVSERAAGRALETLSDHLTTLLPELTRVGYTGGNIEATGLLLPGSTTALPALAIPLALNITEE